VGADEQAVPMMIVMQTTVHTGGVLLLSAIFILMLGHTGEGLRLYRALGRLVTSRILSARAGSILQLSA
jgi:hypothetical protein